MSKWECTDCFEIEDFGCVLETGNNLRPEDCPISGTSCNWEEVKDKDNE